MATDTEFIQELECQSIHMRHWKHRYQFAYEGFDELLAAIRRAMD